jgi:hypothetical protein
MMLLRCSGGRSPASFMDEYMSNSRLEHVNGPWNPAWTTATAAAAVSLPLLPPPMPAMPQPLQAPLVEAVPPPAAASVVAAEDAAPPLLLRGSGSGVGDGSACVDPLEEPAVLALRTALSRVLVPVHDREELWRVVRGAAEDLPRAWRAAAPALRRAVREDRARLPLAVARALLEAAMRLQLLLALAFDEDRSGDDA